MEDEKCEYCTGNDSKRKTVMANARGDYYVVINRCNYLEDSEVGDAKVKFSLIGEKIKFCPMCGREL